jgi:DNA (cytosine-5)-methyltransferase 1
VTRPKILDLFCCAGGAAAGYAAAGFDVVGVDIVPQPNYPFRFVQMDALFALQEMRLDEFDAIHASPPCQGYLNLSRANEALGRELGHERLIAKVRALLEETGLPWVIENVADAADELRDPIRLCGSTFGLPVRRHRLFESSEPIVGAPCNHRWQKVPRYWTGYRPKNRPAKLSTVVQVYGNGGGQHEWGPALGIDWMTGRELAEAIPPAYTEFVGRQLLRFVELRGHLEGQEARA